MIQYMGRSRERITKDDLNKLFKLAKSDIDQFFARNPKYLTEYGSQIPLAVLAQGAALHYVDGKNGVKDFDVWFFYPQKNLTLPYRRRGEVDFGKSKFGKHPDDAGYEGRRVDVLMRSDRYFQGKDYKKELSNYLKYSSV